MNKRMRYFANRITFLLFCGVLIFATGLIVTSEDARLSNMEASRILLGCERCCLSYYGDFKVDKKVVQTDKFIQHKQVKQQTFKVVSRGLPRQSDGSFKTYLPYTAITDRSSEQWKLQQKCKTDKYGFRVFGEYKCVAVGTYYSNKIGDKFIITLDTGIKIKCIVADIKMDIHTDRNHQFVNLPNKNIIEFLVSKRKLDKLSKTMGDISYANDGMYMGSIVRIEQIIE